MYELDRADKCFEHQQSSVQETDRTKVLWDFNIQCDHIIEARRPDILIVEKEEKVCKIIDIAIPGDSRVAEKEREKVEKYQDLKREIARTWSMRKVEVIPIVKSSSDQLISKRTAVYINTCLGGCHRLLTMN